MSKETTILVPVEGTEDYKAYSYYEAESSGYVPWTLYTFRHKIQPLAKCLPVCSSGPLLLLSKVPTGWDSLSLPSTNCAIGKRPKPRLCEEEGSLSGSRQEDLDWF